MSIPRIAVRWCQRPGSFFLVVTTVYLLFVIWDKLGSRCWSQKLLVSPSVLSTNPFYPTRIDLLNLTDFTYLINSDVCGDAGGNGGIFGIIIVHSHPANVYTRNIMRKQIPNLDLMDIGLRRLFLLARAEVSHQILYRNVQQTTLDHEHLLYNDMVQGNFQEHYHNLTYKHMMGLQWVTRYCSSVKYVIKMDDDIAVDIYQLRDLLKYRYTDETRLILGLLQVDARPVRRKESKWYVSEAEYPANTYANFVSGWTYAMTIDAVQSIVHESTSVPYFWIDDVHVTGTLAERAGVRRQSLNKLYTLNVDHLRCCVDLPHHEEYRCDFIVGPSEGFSDVLTSVYAHARFCFINTCKRRRQEESVAKTCVRAKSPPLAPPGPGIASIIKLTG